MPMPLALQSSEASCAFIVIVMGAYWVTEALPLAVTALIPVFAYPLLGIESADEVSSQYLTDSNFVFFGSMIMAVAVEASNLHERIALRILLLTGPNPRWLMLGFAVATAFLSMWISNTATTAMMVPIVVAVIKELDVSHRRQTDPEAVVASDDVEEIIDLDNVDPRQLKVYKGLLLSIAFSASIGGTGTLIGTGANIVLTGYLQKRFMGKSPVTFASWFVYCLPQVIILLAICWAWLQVLFIGFRQSDRSYEGLVRRMLRKKYEALGPLRYDEKNILVVFFVLILLWLFRAPRVIPGWGDLFKEGLVSDGTAAMGISLILFILPAENPFTERRRTGEYRTIMSWKLMRDKFSWSTLFLLGGGYGMASGVEKSGLSHLIGEKLAALDALPEWVFIGLACTMVTALTEFSSNVATASIFIPMVSSIAIRHKTNPLLYILPVTLSSSYAFMFPAGTPPNAIVFGVKILRVVDMAIGGCMLNLCAFVLTQAFSQSYGRWIFGLNEMPAWAVTNGTTH